MILTSLKPCVARHNNAHARANDAGSDALCRDFPRDVTEVVAEDERCVHLRPRGRTCQPRDILLGYVCMHVCEGRKDGVQRVYGMVCMCARVTAKAVQLSQTAKGVQHGVYVCKGKS